MRSQLQENAATSSRTSVDLEAVEDKQALLAEQDIRTAIKTRFSTSWRSPRTMKLGWKKLVKTGKIYRYVGLIILIFLLSAVTIRAIWSVSSAPSSQGDVTQNENSHEGFILDPDWNFKAPPTKREYHWTIGNLEHNPDGVYRPMMLINGQFPGPLIECNEGDTIVVHVRNQAVNATAIHWHGLYQNGTNHMDGTVGITQCPIAPGKEFTYEFKTSGQSGTYWYHSHQGTQVSDGLFGPLIVHSQEEKSLQRLEYSSDRVVMVQDHYHDPSGALLMRYLEPDRENAEPVPDGVLINGKNSRDCDKLPRRRCDNSTTRIPEFNLAPFRNHRLRFINVGGFAEFQIQIDEHQFAVTEVDGTDVQPVYYHRLNISPGQRYSIVLSTNVTSANMFWLRARMVTTCFAEPNPNMEPEIRVVVRYSQADGSSSPSTETAIGMPHSKDWSEVVELVCKDMNTTELVPVKVVAAPSKIDAFFFLRSNFEIGAWKLSRGFFNHSSWRPDVRSPSLDRFIEGHASGNTSFTSSLTHTNEKAFDIAREMVIQINGVRTIDVLIDNFDDGNHPLHLHGYKYFVLAQGHGYFDSQMYESMDFSNPLRRDSASVEAFGWILIRLVTDNPGMWAFHCHISWHMEAGLLMQFLTRPEIVGSWKLPEVNKELCQADGLEMGSGPADEAWFGTSEIFGDK